MKRSLLVIPKRRSLAYCVKYFTQRKIRRKTVTNGERKTRQREAAKRVCIFHVTVSVAPTDYKKELAVSLKALPRVNTILPVFIEGQAASRGNILLRERILEA